MTIAENIQLEQEMSIIRDPLDQTKQMAVNADGSISVSPATNSVQVVSGAAAVGVAPTVPPVGVSGVDGSGLKRALLTDAIGQMMTSEQDSAVFTASVSAASVLFTVDMTNWRSVLLQVTSAGSSCTIIYECSNDQVTWNSTAAVNATIGASSNPSSSTSGITSNYLIQKRGKYIRARVSVYGSGTVSCAYSLTTAETIPAMGVCAWGTAGEGATVNGNPVPMGLECRTIGKTAVANGQVVRPIGTTDGRMVVRPHSVPELEWVYPAASGGIVNSTAAVTMASAPGANARNYVTSIQVYAEALANATELVIREGTSTVYWRIKIPTTGMPPTQFTFENPIRLALNSALTVTTLTASGIGAVYVNAQGYYAP